MAKRYELNDQLWARIAEKLPRRKSDLDRTAKDNHRFVDGMAWVLRSGAQWNELSERYRARTNASPTGRIRVSGSGFFAELTSNPKNEDLRPDAALIRALQQNAPGRAPR